MVGVNGARISNLNPPTLAAVSFGIAQCGLALLLHGPLSRLMRRPLAWAGIALVDLSAMTLFLWHQTAFIVVNSVGLLAGRVPGLLTAPTGGLSVAERPPHDNRAGGECRRRLVPWEVALAAAECGVQRGRADVPHVVGDVDRDSGGNDLVDAVQHVGGQLDPVGGEVAV